MGDVVALFHGGKFGVSRRVKLLEIGERDAKFYRSGKFEDVKTGAIEAFRWGAAVGVHSAVLVVDGPKMLAAKAGKGKYHSNGFGRWVWDGYLCE